MHTIQYSLIPAPATEKAIRTKFSWIGPRPIMLPKGWLGLLYQTCQEIEATLAPNKAKDGVEYFFATVRESRLRIFLQLSDGAEREAHAVIKSLLNEVQSNSALVCHICGKEVLDQNHFNPRSSMPNCGAHDNDGTPDDADDDLHSLDKATSAAEPIKKVDSQIEVIAETEIVAQLKPANENSCLLKSEPSSVLLSEDALTVAPIASIQLYDVSAVRKLLAGVATRYREKEDVFKFKTLFNKLITTGGKRTLMPFPNPAIEFLNQLEADFPNFVQVIDMLRGIHALSTPGEVQRIPAILLLGEPGVGKTMFSEALAKGMQIAFRVIRMENQQAGACLVGSADFWSNSKSGAIFDVLTNGDCGNPVLVVDEVDKAATDSRYSPINGLYSLLEPGSAKSFADESLPDVSLDASKVTWILTANQKDLIPEPILSRVRIFEIPKPDFNQAMQVAFNIYKKLLTESPSAQARFTDDLPHEVAQLLSMLSPRKMRITIEMALGRAALAKRDFLMTQDIDVEDSEAKNRRIGFV